MKQLFKRIGKIAIALSLASVCFLMTGCADVLGGKVFDEIERAIRNGDITQDEGDALKRDYSGGLELDGIKVLRRPLTYDFDENVNYDGRDQELKSSVPWLDTNYYSFFAYDIFDTLKMIYGLVNQGYEKGKTEFSTIFEALKNVKSNEGVEYLNRLYINNSDDLKYFYDAVRYQITDVTEVPAVLDDPDTPEDESHEAYVRVTADTSKSWNWVKNDSGFKYDVTGIQAFVYSNSRAISSPDLTQLPLIKNNYETLYDEDHDLNEKSFSLNNVKESYYENQALFSSSTYSTAFVNSDFIYTLAYAIYCLVLNVPVSSAGYNAAGVWVVDGYSGGVDNPSTEVDERSSAYQAYFDMKEQFKNLGSYVGLTRRNKDAIKNYILNTVIGQNAAYNEFLSGKNVNMYYADVVDAVVEYCGKLTTIGKTETEKQVVDPDSTSVGDSFVASEIIDFPSTAFFISPNEQDEFESISPSEYQSIVFMPSVDEFKVTDLWLDFKYDAKDKDGNIIDDDSLFIKIYVQVRWWTGTELLTIGREITVYNGRIDVGYDNTTLDFEFDVNKGKQNARGDYESFGRTVTIGKFNCEALDVKTNKNSHDETSGFDSMLIKGSNEARHYYEVINSSYGEGYGSYGALKTSRFPGQSYLEIVFDVEKKSSTEKYDFCVGISKFDYYPSAYERYIANGGV